MRPLHLGTLGRIFSGPSQDLLSQKLCRWSLELQESYIPNRMRRNESWFRLVSTILLSHPASFTNGNMVLPKRILSESDNHSGPFYKPERETWSVKAVLSELINVSFLWERKVCVIESKTLWLWKSQNENKLDSQLNDLSNPESILNGYIQLKMKKKASVHLRSYKTVENQNCVFTWWLKILGEHEHW